MSLSFSRTWLFAVFAGAIAVAACDSESSGVSGVSSGYTPVTTDCAQFSSCESCTPASGCGWCYQSNGTESSGSGFCAADANQCAAASWTWTWSVSGCRVPAMPTVADGGGGSTVDGAASLRDSAAEASPMDSASPATTSTDASSSKDAAGVDAVAVDAANVVADAAPTQSD